MAGQEGGDEPQRAGIDGRFRARSCLVPKCKARDCVRPGTKNNERRITMWKWIIIGIVAIAGMFALLLKGGGNVSMMGEHGGDAHPPAAETKAEPPKTESPKADAPKADAPAPAAAPAADAKAEAAAAPGTTPAPAAVTSAAPAAPQTK
jgi:hypothetical protein